MPYIIRIERAAAKELKTIPGKDQRRIAVHIDALKTDPKPNGAIPVQAFQGHWRIRVGNYRVLYHIDDDELVITIVRIAHRREAYR